MRSLLSLIFFFISSISFSQNDLPSNPQPGKCYVRCSSESGNFSEWKAVDCKLVRYQELELDFFGEKFSKKDKKLISRKLLRLLKDGIKLEIRSHYDSKASDSINSIRSLDRGMILADYLSTQKGVNPELILIKAFGNLEVKEQCLENNNCSNIYAKNTRFDYKVISYREGNWEYNEELNVWCKIKDSVNIKSN